MAVCPKCGEDIGLLKVIAKQVVTLDFEAGCAYENPEVADGLLDTEYACIECGEVLFTDEEQANDFLLKN